MVLLTPHFILLITSYFILLITPYFILLITPHFFLLITPHFISIFLFYLVIPILNFLPLLLFYSRVLSPYYTYISFFLFYLIIPSQPLTLAPSSFDLFALVLPPSFSSFYKSLIPYPIIVLSYPLSNSIFLIHHHIRLILMFFCIFHNLSA